MGRTDNLGKPGGVRHAPRWAAAALLLLSGCSSVPDAVNPVEWYRSVAGLKEGDPKPDERNTQNLEAGSEKPYPNLATVPPPPNRAMSTAERERLAAGLAADRANARYIDEQLRFGSTTPAPRAAARSAVPADAAPAASALAPAASAAPAPAPAASSPTQAAPPSPSQQGSRLVAGSALAPGQPAPAPQREAPPQEAPATPPEVRSVPAPETPEPPPPPPRLAQSGTPQSAAPRAPSVARLEPPAAASAERPVVEITFAENSASLAASDRAAIEEAVTRQKQSGGTLRVVGYGARAGGGDAAAQQLAGFGVALDRANAVAQALAEAGASPSSILVEAAPPVAGTGAATRRAQIFVER